MWQIIWGAPDRWWLAALCVAGAILALVNAYREHVRLAGLFGAALEVRVSRFSHMRRIVKTLMLVVAFLCCACAVLMPQWGMREETIQQEMRDVLVMLDISRSMYAQDMKPTRLEFMKSKVRQLLPRLAFERVGLLLFSGTAFVQCPLTNDYSAFLLFLQQVSPESLSSGTTSLKVAFQEGARLFARSSGRTHRLVVLITDGEEFVSETDELVRIVQQERMTVFAWGVGSENGAPVPRIAPDGSLNGYEKDVEGKPVFTKLNAVLLESLARECGGEYITAGYDSSDIESCQAFFERHERERSGEELHVQRYNEQYFWFLGVAFVMFLIEWLL